MVTIFFYVKMSRVVVIWIEAAAIRTIHFDLKIWLEGALDRCRCCLDLVFEMQRSCHSRLWRGCNSHLLT